MRNYLAYKAFNTPSPPTRRSNPGWLVSVALFNKAADTNTSRPDFVAGSAGSVCRGLYTTFYKVAKLHASCENIQQLYFIYSS